MTLTNKVEAESERSPVRDGGNAAVEARRTLSDHVAPLLSGPTGSDVVPVRYAQSRVDVPNLPITDASSAGRPLGAPLDATKTPVELAQSGVISDKSAAARPGDRVREAANATDRPTISVELQDSTNPNSKPPDFSIAKDGTVQMLRNPEQSGSSNVRIQLERENGQLNPTPEQQKAAEELVKYLSDRMKGRLPNARDGVTLDDKDAVVSPDVQRQTGAHAPREQEQMAPETREAVRQAHRLRGSNGVDMPMQATGDMPATGTRTVPRMAGESDREASLKEAWAGLFNADKTAPYETVRRGQDGEQHVGRYGFTSKQIHSFLDMIGNPPDPKKIEELVKAGKLPKDFAEKLKDPEFAKQFKDFADKLASGQNVDKDELKKFMPPEAQEAVAGLLVNSMKGRVGDNAGAISAGMMSGKGAQDVTAGDLSSPTGKQYSEAGQRLFDVASNRANVEAGAGKVGTVPTGERGQLVQKALSAAGVPVTESNMRAVNTIVQHESNWNASIVNNWDSNARKGTPSKGLMQTIGPTFNAHKVPGMDNILNPVHNMAAGIRYAVSRYGSLENVPGIRSLARGGAYRGY
jgi:hypothetical protein